MEIESGEITSGTRKQKEKKQHKKINREIRVRKLYICRLRNQRGKVEWKSIKRKLSKKIDTKME